MKNLTTLRPLLTRRKNNLDFIAYFQNFSPYLSELYRQQSDWLNDHQEYNFESLYAEFKSQLDLDFVVIPTDQLMSLLRIIKKRATLVIALYDIFAELPVQEITQMLSQIADLLISAAFKASSVQWIKRGRLPISIERLEEGSGLIVVAMGKLGGMELNFSSDVDICVFFDPQAVTDVDEYALYDGYVRVVKSAVRLLTERTKDGYVYRVDLRLRPDPASTKVAVPIQAAEYYYERSGQNWERAAWIKGRFIYGDPVSWVKFQTMLRPFIWRRSLDYAAIQDIHSIKRQLNAHYGQHDIKVYSHDVKLGQGGIREIELFVQTQQLIGGGRDLRLRNRSTLQMLQILVEKQWVTSQDAQKLHIAYCFLRKVEHRLQMVNDAQTHETPAKGEAFDSLASFCDFQSSQHFIDEMLRHMHNVNRIYQKLFDDAKPLSTDQGSLVFTGIDYHPDTIKHLEKMGFEQPKTVIDIISNWHKGHYKAMRSGRAREILTELVPILLEKISQSTQPDQALLSLDKFLGNLPAGVAFFSYLNNAPKLMDLLLDIMTHAPNLAAYLSNYPLTFDALMDRSFFMIPQSQEDFDNELRYQIRDNQSNERTMEIIRRFNREQKFRIGVLVLRQIITPTQAGYCFTYLSHLCVEYISRIIQQQMFEKYEIAQTDNLGLCVCALGSAGAFEMHANSDLDLIMIYDTDIDFKSDKIDIRSFYTKVAQRIISALTILTPEGSLYKVDMRLRPSGNSGPLVTSFERFINYQKYDAHIWEYCALTRLYPICGPDVLSLKIIENTQDIITSCDNHMKIKQDIHAMRKKLFDQRPPRSFWDIKQAQGGLFDIIFIMQYFILTKGKEFEKPMLTASDCFMDLFAENQLLPEKEVEVIADIMHKYQYILQIVAIAKLDILKMEKSSVKIKRLLCDILNIEDFSEALSILSVYSKRILQIYNRLFL